MPCSREPSGLSPQPLFASGASPENRRYLGSSGQRLPFPSAISSRGQARCTHSGPQEPRVPTAWMWGHLLMTGGAVNFSAKWGQPLGCGWKPLPQASEQGLPPGRAAAPQPTQRGLPRPSVGISPKRVFCRHCPGQLRWLGVLYKPVFPQIWDRSTAFMFARGRGTPVQLRVPPGRRGFLMGCARCSSRQVPTES